MTTDEQSTASADRDALVNHTAERCPFIDYDDVMLPHTDALWHSANFDRLRDDSTVYAGTAGGRKFWMFTRMEDIRSALQNPEVYSSSALIPTDPDPEYVLVPEMLEPSLHGKWRKLLAPFFSPRVVERLRPAIVQRMDEILDEVVERGSCDYVRDVALKFPNYIFFEYMGLPVEHMDQFEEWSIRILHGGTLGKEKSLAAMGEVSSYFENLIRERRSAPRDDLLSHAVRFDVDGETVSDKDLLSLCLLLFLAGLATVVSQLSYSMLHLATHADDRQRLVDDPSLGPSAVEELTRFYANTQSGRKLTQNVEVRGQRLSAGSMVFLPLICANRDAEEFPEADRVVIDRQNNRHIAFGAGPHRCIGSHLAREEMAVALSAWHRKIPHYRLTEGIAVTEHGENGLLGLKNLPLSWD